MKGQVLEKLMALDEPAEARIDGIDYPGLGFTEADAPSLLAVAMGEHLKGSQAEGEAWDVECDAAIHAARALASLRNVEYLDDLLEMLRCADRNQDEFFLADFPLLMRLMGSGASQALRQQLANRNETEGFRASVLEALEVELVHETGKDELAKALAELLAAKHPDYSFNAFAVCALLSFKASQYIDVIKKAIEADVVDLSICGDVEDVEIGLGFREDRVTPTPNYSSLAAKYHHLARKAELGELASDAEGMEVLSYYLALYGLPESLVRVEQLDGLVLAAILSPRRIPVSKLLSVVWVGSEGEGQPIWEDKKDVERFYGAFFEFYNNVISYLGEGSYEPILSVKQTEDGRQQLIYTMWLTGFSLGLSLWKDDTSPAKMFNEELFDCVRKILVHELGEDTKQTEVPDELIERLIDNVYLLHEKNNEAAAAAFSKGPARQKAGRNDACPCGSGKKYKKCCMGNDGAVGNLISLN